MKPSENPISPVVTLLSHVYKHANGSKNHSWELLNYGLRKTLDMAIRCGFAFERDDFEQISNRFDFGYWCGTDSDKMSAEQLYSLAVSNNNRGACIAFEQWKNRKPYFLNSARLAVGSEFLYREHPVAKGLKQSIFRLHVTYIGADKIGCCWYENPGNHQSGKPKRRFEFTHQELKTAQKNGMAALNHDCFQSWALHEKI